MSCSYDIPAPTTETSGCSSLPWVTVVYSCNDGLLIVADTNLRIPSPKLSAAANAYLIMGPNSIIIHWKEYWTHNVVLIHHVITKALEAIWYVMVSVWKQKLKHRCHCSWDSAASVHQVSPLGLHVSTPRSKIITHQHSRTWKGGRKITATRLRVAGSHKDTTQNFQFCSTSTIKVIAAYVQVISAHQGPVGWKLGMIGHGAKCSNKPQNCKAER